MIGHGFDVRVYVNVDVLCDFMCVGGLCIAMCSRHHLNE